MTATNATPRHAAISYFRADYILVATTVCVCAIVLLLLFTLATENALHRQTLRTIQEARGARDAALSLTQALASADAERRAALIGSDRGAQLQYGDAKRDARTHVRTIDGVSDVSPVIAAAAAEVHRLTEQYLAELDSVTAAQLRSDRLDPTANTRGELTVAVDVLRERVNAHNDVARSQEDRVRRSIDAIAAMLAGVAFLAPVLAILAVRRERRIWRESHALAETARAQAAASDVAKSRFLAAASHDMRQPLHALSLYISALQRRVDTEEARDILTRMDRATQSLVGMFSKLLDLARVQASAVRLDIGPVRLQDVIDRVAAENPGRSVEVASTDAIVSTDPVMLERLLGNLVANALKHGGGHARILVEDGEADVVLTVADDGPGIAEADQARVFDEFVRLGRGGEGLGLGLSIVKRIAEVLDLELELVSSPGAGARFSLRLPRDIEATPAPGPTPNADALVGQTVLVVDDDELAREAMTRAISDLGAEVRAGANGADAHAICDAGFTPRLILMDLRIDNEIVGIELAQHLRQKIAPHPAVIIITGDTGPETLASLKLSGFAWLIKPVDPSDLRQAALSLVSST